MPLQRPGTITEQPEGMMRKSAPPTGKDKRMKKLYIALCLALLTCGWGSETRGEEPLIHENLFFLHHSTGRNIINEGNMREWFATFNGNNGTFFEFWDHDYNNLGLRDPAGNMLGYSYNIPNDNTDPDGLHYLWTTSNSASDSILANHDVIAFKSCYPASAIESEAQLDQYKTWYLDMAKIFDRYPQKVFLVLSPPPLHRLSTNVVEADLARAFARWLASDDFLKGRHNIKYFDLFDHLAHPEDGSVVRNMLRAEYEISPYAADSHPNTLANQTVGPALARAFVLAAGIRTPTAQASMGVLKTIFR
jgi:hypothetical protein